MKRAMYVILLTIAFAVTPTFAQSFEFEVEHKHTLRNCRGKLLISQDGIEYQTDHKKDGRTWLYLDIRQVKVESPTEIEITSYEDKKWMPGQDRTFKFKLLEGKISPDIAALLMNKAKRPVVTSIMPESEGEPVFQIPVKHSHTFGGCEGMLKIYPDRITYESSDQPSNSRYWRYTDIQNFSHSSRFRFEITSFEDKLGGPKSYNFDLKEEMPAQMYDYVWMRVYPVKFQ